MEKKDNRTAPASVPRTRPTSTVLVAPSVPTLGAVPNGGAHEHLQAALQELTQRNQQIEVDLARLEVLHVEKESIRKQIDAVNVALQAFGG